MAISRSEERALIEQARRDRRAFGKLYELHVDRIFNYIYYRTGNQHDAEDLTARVFFKAIQHISHYKDKGAPFAAWLYTIARNMLANFYRDRSKRQHVPLDNVNHREDGDGPELWIQKGQEKEALLAAIRNLPPDRQELLILKYIERMTNSEIGQIMDRSEGAIKSLYFRTLKSLRYELDRQYQNDNNGGQLNAYRDG
jgi:RNA polymerase sigma-70 factor (ECF subfamily)